MRVNKIAMGVARKLAAAIFLSLISVQGFALEPYVTDIYEEIDSAFSKKSDSSLNMILQKNQGDKYYYLIENYATKKVRRLVITNDFEFAMNAILVIIDNDMDNTEAVEMYSSISDAFEIQKAFQEKEAERKRQEKQRIAILKEEQRTAAEKEYKTIKSEDGTSVFVTGKDAKLVNYLWDFHIGFIPGIMVLAPGDSSVSPAGAAPVFQMGGIINFDFVRSLPELSWGFNVFTELKFLNESLKKDDYTCNAIFTDLEVLPKIAINKLSKNLYLRGGFVFDANLDPDKSKSELPLNVMQPSFMTPAVGIEFSNIKMGNVLFKFSYDYYLGHIWTENLKTAMGAELKFTIPFAEADKFKLSFDVGIRDRFYVRNAGIDNRASLILALGAENVIH